MNFEIEDEWTKFSFTLFDFNVVGEVRPAGSQPLAVSGYYPVELDSIASWTARAISLFGGIYSEKS